MNKLSLFSGIGGIDLAAQWAEMKTVAFCEKEPFPQKVLRKRWPDVPIYDDVTTLTKEVLERDGIRTINLISAGYPCQPFSHAGQRRGEEDDRHLWPEVKRILEEIRPRWFVGENVAGHVTLGLDDVLADLGGAGYTAQAMVIPAAAIGASHRRDRVFLLGYTERCGRGGQPWGRSREKSPNGYIELEEGTMADTKGERCGEAWEPSERSEERTSFSGSMGYADSIQPQREQPAWIGAVERRSQAREYQGSSDGAEQQRPTESRLGGSPYELSDWLDGGINPLDALSEFISNYPQPALMGQEQYAWEPLRVAIGIKNRADRLKALGNAVNPLQIYPILHAIKVIDDWLMR